MLLASPSLRKLSNFVATGGALPYITTELQYCNANAGGGLATRESWGGRGVLSTIFSPSDVRGLGADAQVTVVVAMAAIVIVAVSVVPARVSICHHGTQVMIDRHFGDIGTNFSASGVGSGGGGGVDDAAAFASWSLGNRVIGGPNESAHQIASSVVMTIIARSLGEDESYSPAAAAAAEVPHALRSNSSSVPSRSQFFTEAERGVTLGEFDAFMSATDRR
jgi:hypothetical protein